MSVLKDGKIYGDIKDLEKALCTRRPKRDGYGDSCLEGRRGNIHEDGMGYSVYATFKSNRALNRCKDAFSGFMELRQDGDAEAVFHLPKLPTPEQAKLIRYWLGLPKRRILSDEQRAALVATGMANLSKVHKAKQAKNAPERTKTEEES